MWEINVELIQQSTCLEDVLRWFGERRINEEIGLWIAKKTRIFSFDNRDH